MRLLRPRSFWLLILPLWLLAFDDHAPIQRAFQHGEYLKFRMDYGFINAGYASLEVAEKPVMVDGHACYHIIGKGWSNATWDKIYKIRDRYESWVDQDKLVSRRFERYLNEGKFHSIQKVRFEQEQGKARYYDPNRGDQTYRVPKQVQDVLSAFFYARSRYDHRNLEVGDRISLRNFLDRKVYGLEAQMLARETIEVGDHTFKALKFDLLIEEAGFITDGSEIHFWISDDLNKIPLRIECELMIGSLDCDLIEWRGLRHPLTSLQ
mgnify:CR=1 FL=1